MNRRNPLNSLMGSPAARLTVASALSAALSLAIPTASGAPLGTAFTFQGLLRLQSTGQPINGSVDVQFKLYYTATAGSQIGTTQSYTNTIANGFVSTPVDFGALAFDGTARWLEVSVRYPSGNGSYAVQSPRIPIEAVPYAQELALPLAQSAGTSGTPLFSLSQLNASNAGPTLSASQAADDYRTAAVLGQNSSAGNNVSAGLRGVHTGNGIGVLGEADGPTGSGMIGEAYGVNGTAIFGNGRASNAVGVVGQNEPTGNKGQLGTPTEAVSGQASVLANNVVAVRGTSISGAHGELASYFSSGGEIPDTYSIGVSGAGDIGASFSGNQTGIQGFGTNTGVFGQTLNNAAYGVFGQNPQGWGVLGYGDSGTNYAGVWGTSNSAAGVHGATVTGWGVYSECGDGGNALGASWNGSGASTNSTNNVAIFRNHGASIARIDQSGRGYFDGGTQSGGADVAEAFRVEGDVGSYQPGDVLVVSIGHDRTVAKSVEPYSTLIAGVLATKPGVLLTERDISDPLSDTVPLGIVGVIPTRVSCENGPIHRGDLLVSSSTPGCAMRGVDRSRMLGAIIGKALADFTGSGEGTIEVMVNVK